MRAVAVLFVVMLPGCASRVITEYSELRLQTLADPGPVPEGWRPDAVLVLAPEVVEQIVGAALAAHGNVRGELEVAVPLVGTAVLTPDLAVTDLALGAGSGCDDCVALRASLDGAVGWRLGRSSGRVPVSAEADLDADLETTRQGDGSFLVTARPRRVRDLDVSMGGSVALLGPLLGSELGGWLQEDLEEWVAPIALGTLGGENVPLRAARVRGTGAGIAVDLLTRSSTPQPLQGGDPAGVRGWELRVATGSLLDVARRESFVHGPLAHGVVVDPRSLSFEEDGLVLGMRLWRPVGRGWWRDYDVRLDLQVGATDLNLKATSVEEAGHSKGAAWVDPLVALAEGRILEGMERAIRANAPAGWAGDAGAVAVEAAVREVTGGDGYVRVAGDLRARAAADRPTGSDPSRKPTSTP